MRGGRNCLLEHDQDEQDFISRKTEKHTHTLGRLE